MAATPTRVSSEIRQPQSIIWLIPKVSSERRTYIPIGFLPDYCDRQQLASSFLEKPPLYHFGILIIRHAHGLDALCLRAFEKRLSIFCAASSTTTSRGRRASPTNSNRPLRPRRRACLRPGRTIPDASLAALYDPLTMPPDLVKAHRKLDAAVDAAYAKRKFSGDRDRLAFLFELYQQILSPLSAKKNLRRK